MSFTIATDTSANLRTPYLKKHGVALVAFHYTIDGREHSCTDTETYDGAAFFSALRGGTQVTTSLVTPQQYLDCFTPLLRQGQDILFVGMSSGISGSYASSEIAATQLREEFPQRTICTVDTLAASLGEGLFVQMAIQCRDEGMQIEDTARHLLAKRQSLYQGVLLEDLMHLRRSGRISGAKAVLGTVFGIRPLLKGDAEGRLTVCGKVRGKRAGLMALAERYREAVEQPEMQTVCIAYTDNPAEAEALAQLLQVRPPKELLKVCYEPVTGSHLGPGAIALFFWGKDGVREL